MSTIELGATSAGGETVFLPVHGSGVLPRQEIMKEQTFVTSAQPVEQHVTGLMVQDVKLTPVQSVPSTIQPTPISPPKRAQTEIANRDRSSSVLTTDTRTTGTSFVTEEGDDDDESEDCVKAKRVKEWSKNFEHGNGEELVCTHGCALVIAKTMVHGRIYITQKKVYFRSNIMGIKTKRVFPISSITSISPKNVAGMIPNAIEVLHTITLPTNGSSSKSSDANSDDEAKRSLFTTLSKRDHTLTNLMTYWNKENPEAYEAYISGQGQEAVPANIIAAGRARGGSTATQQSTHDSTRQEAASVSRADANKNDVKQTTSAKGDKTADKDGNNAGGKSHGPHAATKADTPDLEKQALHTTLPVDDPKKCFELLYKKEEFLRGIWEDQGMTSIEMQPWTDGKRTFTYSRPLGGKFGSTKCESEETIIHPDDSKDWWGVEGTTRTPGVPGGKSFLTRSKTTFSYAEGGGTLMHATFQVEWTGKSMLKSMINGQAESGQQEWNALLKKNMKEYIRAHPDEFPSANGDALDEDDEDVAPSAKTASTTGTAKTRSNATTTSTAQAPTDDPIEWIMGDPLRSALAAVALTLLTLYLWSLLKGLFTGDMVSISRKRLRQLELIEASHLATVAQAAKQTIVQKVIRPKV